MGVNVNGVDLLFDPFITPNELAKHIDINSVPADYILVSHGHEDHLADVQTIAERTGAKIVSNFEIVSWFAEEPEFDVAQYFVLNLFAAALSYLSVYFPIVILPSK